MRPAEPPGSWGGGLLLACAVSLVACGHLTTLPNGAVTLEIVLPATTSLEVGDTIRLRARALDLDGNPVAATIEWGTPDSVIAVESATGLVTGLIAGGGLGRVQAVIRDPAFTLASGFVSFSILARPDSLVLIGDSVLTVAATETMAGPLVAELRSHQPAGPLPNRNIVYEIVDPVFPTPADRTVELLNRALIDTVLTAATGQPSPPVLLLRVAGTSAPDSVVVVIRADRATGEAVPGSGQRFRVRFVPAAPLRLSPGAR